MAGSIDKLMNTYSSRFFSEIRVFALTADAEVIRKRMTEGRGIQDEGWIQSSIEHNEYLKTHDAIGNTKYQTTDCSDASPSEVAKKVLGWLKGEM